MKGTYQRKGGGRYSVTRLLCDGVLTTSDGRRMEFKAGDCLVTRWEPLPVKQWPIESDAAKEFYEHIN